MQHHASIRRDNADQTWICMRQCYRSFAPRKSVARFLPEWSVGQQHFHFFLSHAVPEQWILKDAFNALLQPERAATL